MKIGSASLTINDIEMNWDEDSRRKEKPCVVCGKLTKGRMSGVGGLKKAAHIFCAMNGTFDKAKLVYGGAK